MKYQVINGKIVSAEEALIPTNDLGMLRAYGAFDYFRVLENVPVFVEDHVDRLYHSLDVLDLEIKYSKEEICDLCQKLVDKNNVGEAGLRILVTGGYSEDGFTPTEPNLYIMMHSLPNVPEEHFEQGAKLLTSPYQRDVPSVKTIIYIQSVHFRKKMRAQNAVEVLYHWKGNITECSRSNIFFIDQEGTLVTPRHGMLRGITRKKVLELAEPLMPIAQRAVHMEELAQMRECFITSSTKGVMPIVSIDDTIIADGKPGVLTQGIRDQFLARVKAYIQAAAVV